jgi:hypothetical protein
MIVHRVGPSDRARNTRIIHQVWSTSSNRALGRYSARSVIVGSTRAARVAGIQQATIDTAMSKITTLAYVIGSTAETP